MLLTVTEYEIWMMAVWAGRSTGYLSSLRRERGLQETPYHLASSLGRRLIYNCCLISQKEGAAPAASAPPSSPLILQLPPTFTLFSSFFYHRSLLFVLLYHPPLSICLSVACFNSLTSRAIIPALLFSLQRKKKEKARGGRQGAVYIK